MLAFSKCKHYLCTRFETPAATLVAGQSLELPPKMAKVYGVSGVIKGKVGSIVYRIRRGETIASQYQPAVSNPSTPNQVKSRAILKLLSQVGAAVENVIAIPRDGSISPRNQFTQVNYEHVNYAGQTANLVLADMQLTKSAQGLAGFTASRDAETGISIELQESQSGTFDRIVYVGIMRNSAGALVPFASQVVSVPGANGTFPAILPYQAGDISLHAYGIKDKSIAATAAFNNLNVPSAQGIAQVIASRTLKVSDYSLSQTRGLFMDAETDEDDTTGLNYARMVVHIVQPDGTPNSAIGSVSGGGRKQIGQSWNLQATALLGATFLGWRSSATGAYASQANPFQVPVANDSEIYAVFQPQAGGGSTGDGSDQ